MTVSLHTDVFFRQRPETTVAILNLLSAQNDIFSANAYAVCFCFSDSQDEQHLEEPALMLQANTFADHIIITHQFLSFVDAALFQVRMFAVKNVLCRDSLLFTMSFLLVFDLKHWYFDTHIMPPLNRFRTFCFTYMIKTSMFFLLSFFGGA